MDIESILAISLIFGGGTVIALAFSPVGRAVAARIHGRGAAEVQTDPAVLEELDHLRNDVSELQERLDFTERLLAKAREEQGSAPA